MNILDIILVIPLLWFAYKGFTKGLIIELSSLGALILGVYAAYYFSDYAKEFLTNNFEIKKQYLQILSFAVTFIVVVILVLLLGKILEKFVNLIALGFLNKLAGGIFGILKVAFVLSVIIFIINSFDEKEMIISEKMRKESVLYKPISSFAPKVIPKIKNLGKSSFIEKVKKDKDKFLKPI